MPNWKDTPHDEKCPCCGADRRWATDLDRQSTWHEYIECLYCGHYEHHETPQDDYGDEPGIDYGDDDDEEDS